MFGPLIDAPPSHPDTVLTTLSYFEKTLTELGMKTSNLSADMQLYIVATLIKWASHGNRFKSVILRPGGMHTLMSSNGCIGNLMIASGLEVLVGAAFAVLSTFNLGNNVTMDGREESMYSHDEADITIISYLLEVVKNGKELVRVTLTSLFCLSTGCGDCR